MNYQALLTKQAQKAIRHWIYQRASAVFLGPAFVFLLINFLTAKSNYIFDVYNFISISCIITTLFSQNLFTLFLLFFVTAFLFIHILEGVESIIIDYIHNPKTVWLAKFLLQCTLIMLLKHIFLFIF